MFSKEAGHSPRAKLKHLSLALRPDEDEKIEDDTAEYPPL
jgi:hypothetical protein